MKTVGIISEYNPFHDGHAYHIRQAKAETGADCAVVIMNGDFVQRGEPAIFNKYIRTEQALDGGADIVFELPIRFGLSSAGDFAFGGIMALESLGFIDSVCFGSEAGCLTPFLEAADILVREPEAFGTNLRSFLRRGMSFPAARTHALSEISGMSVEFMQTPNNILAVEYCVALQRLSSSIQPFTIRRIGQDYHGENNDAGFPSASALRRNITKSRKPHLTLEDFSSVIGYALLSNPDLTHCKDISSDLCERIAKFLPNYQSVTALIRQCSNPSITRGRIRRALLQCLLHIEKTNKTMPYLRLLGMKKEASSLLSQREDTSCQILTRLAVDCRELNPQAFALLKQDLFASDLYRQIYCQKYGQRLPNEYQHSPLIR